jgi:hypothetical protein
MGRSISTPTGAQVCFTVLEPEADDDDALAWEFECLVDRVIDDASRAFPSFYRCDMWRGREDHVLLRNAYADLGISCLGSMVAIWVVERNDGAYYYYDADRRRAGRARHWLARIAPRFEGLFGDYDRVGTMSNGESFYRKREQSC